MRKSRFTEEQITFALRQAEAGMPVAEVCQQLGSPRPRSMCGRRSTATSVCRSSESCASSGTKIRGSSNWLPT
ncbi:hypothetical protein D3879_24965 [Pseudomonas cavernicola]|uniref:Transposase n=1 Tax=Pseudomonas cavernicola TaxID=2320866 RepID=A0A418X9B2_9PSED|nr:hypothetical protein D3879_24965 [Pseudomonas cavernicola]